MIVIVESYRTCRGGNINNIPINTQINLLDRDFLLTAGARDSAVATGRHYHALSPCLCRLTLAA
jgi:hypothetical protein